MVGHGGMRGRECAEGWAFDAQISCFCFGRRRHGCETSVTFAATATDGHSESNRDVSTTVLSVCVYVCVCKCMCVRVLTAVFVCISERCGLNRFRSCYEKWFFSCCCCCWNVCNGHWPQVPFGQQQEVVEGRRTVWRMRHRLTQLGFRTVNFQRPSEFTKCGRQREMERGQ